MQLFTELHKEFYLNTAYCKLVLRDTGPSKNISSSNALVENGFSIPRKMHTGERSSLNQFSNIDWRPIEFKNHSCFH